MLLEQSGCKVTGQSNGAAALIDTVRHPHPMTSGHIDPQDQITAIRLGVRTVLVKPVSRKEPLAALHDIFQERGELAKSLSA